jgi:pilus assembly protein Flp/PilA
MLQLFAVYLSAALKSRKGISALEYAILAGVLLAAVSGAVSAFGTDIDTLFTNVGNNLTAFKPTAIGS